MRPFYDDGQVTIYHGDCREMDLRALGATALVTDPPYGIGFVHGEEKSPWASKFNGIPVHGDDEPFDPRPFLDIAPQVIMWGANHYAHLLPPSPGWLVWDKRGPGMTNDQSDCELAWSNVSGTARMFYLLWSGFVRGGEDRHTPRVHPTQKPIALMRWCLGFLGPAVVLDPFMGSGTTLRAASDLGLSAIGIEIDERYCEIAAQRLSQMPLLTSAVG